MQFRFPEPVEIFQNIRGPYRPAVLVRATALDRYVVQYAGGDTEEVGEAVVRPRPLQEPQPLVHRFFRMYPHAYLDVAIGGSWWFAKIQNTFRDRNGVLTYRVRRFSDNHRFVVPDSRIRTHFDWIDGRWFFVVPAAGGPISLRWDSVINCWVPETRPTPAQETNNHGGNDENSSRK